MEVNEEDLLEVISISEVKPDRRGRNYKTLTFVPCEYKKVDGHTKRVKSNDQPRVRNVWEAFNDPDSGYFPADGLYAHVKVGDLVYGKIYTFDTEAYEIEPGKKVNKATFVVFSNEDPNEYAANEMRNRGVGIVVEGGEVIKKEPTVVKANFMD